MAAHLLTLLADLAAAGLELGADGDRLRYRPAQAMSSRLGVRVRRHREELLELVREAGWGPFTAAELLAHAQGEKPAWSEDAEYGYAERLGVAMDLDLDTSPGSPAEVTARREADAVNTLPASAWPGTPGAAVIAAATRIFGGPCPSRNPEHPPFQSGDAEPLLEQGGSPLLQG